MCNEREERFEPIQGYEGLYEVGNFGTVRSVSRPMTRTHVLTNDGRPNTPRHWVSKEKVLKFFYADAYRRVRLYRDSIDKDFKIHRLVAAAFCENPEGKPCVNHIDGDPENNRYDNLEWCTVSENVRHANRTGLRLAPRGEKSTSSKLKESVVRQVKQMLAEGVRQFHIAERLGLTFGQVHDIKRGRVWAWLTI